jgi:pimeloyl-ACP methyl ester carboxylesterase
MQKKRYPGYYFRLFSVLSVLLMLAVIFITGYSVNAWTQSMLHPRRIPSTGDSLPGEQISYQDITLTTRDGMQLAAWYSAPENGAVILLAHGYGDNRLENMYGMLARNGYGVLAWDFRAHGESGGDTSTLGYFEQLDVEAALDYALAQDGVEHIGAWGGSMGGATIILTAAKRMEIEALVADSAFPSLEDVLRGSMPYEFLFPLVKTFGEYQSGGDISAVSPVLEIGKISPRAVFIIDGWDGNAKEISSPYRLYNAADEPKVIWTEREIPHMGMQARFPNQYENKVLGFFDEWLLGK